MIKVAIFLRDITNSNVIRVDDGHHTKKLWAVTPKVDGSRYVITSARRSENAQGIHETLVFPGDKSGNITEFCEVGGLRCSTDHEEAIRTMGYSPEVD